VAVLWKRGAAPVSREEAERIFGGQRLLKLQSDSNGLAVVVYAMRSDELQRAMFGGLHKILIAAEIRETADMQMKPVLDALAG